MQYLAIAVVFAVTGWMLKTWLSHREKMTELSMTAQRLDSSEQRLANVEHTVEATAVEIERISEGQRYVTSLLNDRVHPLLDGVPIATQRTDTPH